MDLRELIETNRRGRSVESLGRALGRSGNTVRGWASGKYPLPEYQASPMAEWLGVSEETVITAANESRRGAVESHDVGGNGQASHIAKAGGRGKELMADERAEIVGALASIGQQLIDLAQRIERAGGDGEQG